MDALNLDVPLRRLREMKRQSDHDGAARQQHRPRTSPTCDSAEYAKQVKSQRQPQFGSIRLGNSRESGQPMRRETPYRRHNETPAHQDKVLLIERARK